MPAKDRPLRSGQAQGSTPSSSRPLSRQERRRQERQKEFARQHQRQAVAGSRRYIIAGAAAVAVVIVAIAGYFAFSSRNASGAVQPGQPIDGITCQAEMLQYHIHAHITLYRNGQLVVLPAQIGIPINPNINVGGQNYCLYWLHTHAFTNVIHIESPTAKTYTLGQFFDIWHYTALWDAQSTLAASAGVTVDSSFVDALRAAKPGQVHAYVGSKPVPSYKDIKLTDHELITVEIGTPLKPPTTSFDWKHWGGA